MWPSMCTLFFSLSSRWWPSEVVLPEDIPDNILSKKPGDCMFVVRFCGSRDFCWTYHGRVLPYTYEADLEGMRGHKKPKTTDNYKKGAVLVCSVAID